MLILQILIQRNVLKTPMQVPVNRCKGGLAHTAIEGVFSDSDERTPSSSTCERPGCGFSVGIMSLAIIYHWRIKAGTEEVFAQAWKEGTRAIHEHCGSFGARLHAGRNNEYWSYARWPSEAQRQACFADSAIAKLKCFAVMKECVEQRFEEVSLELVSDLLDEKKSRHSVPLLTTERLLLRPLAYSDAARLVPALSDEANMRYWSRGPLANEQQVREYLRWNIESAGVQCFAICHASNPQDAHGWVILMDGKAGEVEIGFILRPDMQGQGIAKEASACAIDYAFTTRGLRRVMGDVDPENKASIALLESLGMRREGRLRGNWQTHLGSRDSYIYGRLRSDEP